MQNPSPPPPPTSTGPSSSQVAAQLQLALLEKPGMLAQRALYGLGGVLVVSVIWASLSQCDVCAEAEGEMLSRTRIQVIRSAIDGSVEKYLVENGSDVKKGDPLVILNSVTAESDLKKARQELSGLEVQHEQHVATKAALDKVIANPYAFKTVTLTLAEPDRAAGEVYSSKQALDTALFDAGRGAGTGTGTGTAAGKSRTSSGSDQVDALGKAAMDASMRSMLAERQALQDERIARQQSLARRADVQAANLKVLQSQISMLNAEVKKKQAELKELHASLDDALGDQAIFEKGKKLGVASGVKFLQVQDYVHQREYLVLQCQSSLAALQQQAAAAELDLKSAKSGYKADRAEIMAGIDSTEAQAAGVPLEINATTRNLAAQRAQFKVAMYNAKACAAAEARQITALDRKIIACQASCNLYQRLLDDRVVRAPLDGTVSQSTRLAPGQLISRGQELMRVVPADKQLIMRAHVRSADIGFVKVGQTARIRLAAFPCEEFGVIDGKVERVGDYPEETSQGSKHEFTYRVTIAPEREWIKSSSGNAHIPLRIGLDGHADIVVRRRTLMMLLLEPIFKTGE